MKLTEYLDIEAAAKDGKHTVRGVAYSGGAIRLGGWGYPVVIDFSGMTVPDTVPLLANHVNRTYCRIGLVRPSLTEAGLGIDGEIVATGEDAAEIVAQAKAGAEWQLSVGAEVGKYEFVKEGVREVNGRQVDAPFYHVLESTLREVSVVAVGADRTTRMAVTAAFELNLAPGAGEKDMDMKDNKTATPAANGEKAAAVAATDKGIEAKAGMATDEGKKTPDAKAMAEAAVKAERERVASIRGICDGEFPDIEAKAVDEGWTPEKTTAEVLAAFRRDRPEGTAGIIVRNDKAPTAATLEAAMCLRAGIPADDVAKDYGEKAAEAAWADRDISLRGLLTECVRAEGGDVPRSFGNDTIRAAFSTVSLPGILSNVANKKLLQSYQAQPIIATKLCTAGDLNDFKVSERFRLTDMGDLKPVAPDGEIKDMAVVEETASNQLDTYAKRFCLTRKMIIDDDLGAFLKVPAGMGNRAARLVDQLFFKRLLANPAQADGQALFSAKHKNLLSGAKSALSADSLKTAIRTFMDQVDIEGEPISVEPRILLVPTALKYLAMELTRGTALIMAGGSEATVRPALNVLADENLEVVSSPYLSNGKYAGASEAAWYLFGQPGVVDTFEIGYLKGRRTPTVERGDTDFTTLGTWFRVYFDVGVREQDHRGMFKAAGN